MRIRSFFNRFAGFKKAPVATRKGMQGQSGVFPHKPAPIQRSELTALFRSVLEEKRDDLPSNRK